MARDLHCYCIQANSSDCGDSRITQPSKHDDQDILRVKGGDAPTILVGTIDIERLRRFQCKGYGEQKADGYFKPTPPLFNKKVVEKKNSLGGKNYSKLCVALLDYELATSR